MPDDDDPGSCSGDGDVEAFCVACEAHDPGCVCSDETDDHEVGLVPLCCIDGADLHSSVAVLCELLSEQRVLASVWCEHQDAGRVCVLPGDRAKHVFHRVCLHLIAGAAAIAELLSVAVDVHHAVTWFPFRWECAHVFGTYFFGAPCWWPWDSKDFLKRFFEPAFEDPVAIPVVGAALDVRVHSVLDLEHDEVFQALVVSVEACQ